VSDPSQRDLPAREREILDVTGELLTEIGYERLTIDAVAARAHASKATIYRRWPGKPALVAAALRHLTCAGSSPAEYTGDLRADLLAHLRAARDQLAARGSLLAGLVTAMRHDPELAALVRADIARCQAGTSALLARHAAVGNLRPPPEGSADVELVRQLAPAQVLTRILVTGEPVDEDFLARLVDGVLLPLLRPRVRVAVPLPAGSGAC
jgi:AcrR family transcriptional regulator